MFYYTEQMSSPVFKDTLGSPAAAAERAVGRPSPSGDRPTLAIADARLS